MANGLWAPSNRTIGARHARRAGAPGRPDRGGDAGKVRGMRDVPLAASDHPDRIRWNTRYGGGAAVSFHAHPLAAQALSLPLPAGPVLDLACGPSGAGLAAAAAGRQVTAVDISD